MTTEHTGVETASPATPAETNTVNQERAAAWRKVEEAFRAQLHEPDLTAVRIAYAAIAAHRLPGVPVWLFDVEPPSSGKTVKLMPLKPAVGAHIISTVTPQTFISGWTWRTKKGQTRDASLLHRIGPSGIIVCKDFSQVLSMPRKQKGPILADLRDIYDGHIAKEFGTGEHKEWSGRITFVAGVTPDLDQHYTVYQILGERFVQVRSDRPGGVQAALAAMRQNPTALHKQLNEVVTELFRPIFQYPQDNPDISDRHTFAIANLAEFAVRARTHVPRDGRSREIIYMPQPEASPRLAQQLAQLPRGSAMLDGRGEVNEYDLSLVRRVAFDSVRADRRAILETLEQEPGGMAITALAERVGLSQPTTSRRIEELKGLGLVQCEGLGLDFSAQEARLSDLARRLLEDACGE